MKSPCHPRRVARGCGSVRGIDRSSLSYCPPVWRPAEGVSAKVRLIVIRVRAIVLVCHGASLRTRMRGIERINPFHSSIRRYMLSPSPRRARMQQRPKDFPIMSAIPHSECNSIPDFRSLRDFGSLRYYQVTSCFLRAINVPAEKASVSRSNMAQFPSRCGTLCS